MLQTHNMKVETVLNICCTSMFVAIKNIVKNNHNHLFIYLKKKYCKCYYRGENLIFFLSFDLFETLSASLTASLFI